MSISKTIVLKFGGSVIHSSADFDRIQSEIQRYRSRNYNVIAVVSAYFGVTERLISEAKEKRLDPASSEYAQHIANGEFKSAADLVAHLCKNGINASRQSPANLKFIAQGARDSGAPVRISSVRIESALAKTQVIVVPGYSAIDINGDCILLGRGGSDISAVCIAESLKLNCVRLLKDVDGLYDVDPNKYENANRLDHVDYATAKMIGGELIQTEAIDFAASRHIFIDIAAIGKSQVSRIGPTVECNHSYQSDPVAMAN